MVIKERPPGLSLTVCRSPSCHSSSCKVRGVPMSTRLVQIASLYQAVCVAVLSLGSLFLWVDGALGVFSGGLLMAANFWALRTMLERLFFGSAPKKRKAVYAVLLATKFCAVLAAMAVLVLIIRVSALGLAIGMATLFVGVALALVHQSLFTRSQAI